MGDVGLFVGGMAAILLTTYLGIRICLGFQDRNACRKAEPYLNPILSLTEISDPIERGKRAAELLKPVRGHPLNQHMIDDVFRSDSFSHVLADLTLFMNSERNRISSHISDLLFEHLKTQLASHDDPRQALQELMEMCAPFLEGGYDGEPLTLIEAWAQSVEKLEDPKTRFDLYMEGAKYIYEAGFPIGSQPLMMKATLAIQMLDPADDDSVQQQMLEMAEWMQGQVPEDITSQLDELNPRMDELNQKLVDGTISEAELEELRSLEEEATPLMEAQVAAFYGIDPDGQG